MGVGNRVWGLALAGVMWLVGCSDEHAAKPRPEVGTAIAAPLRSSSVAAARSDLARMAPAIATLDAALELEVAAPTAPREEELACQGPAPTPLAESTRALDRSSPEALLTSTLSALAAKDLAALARASVARPRLTQDDAAAAERRFLSPAMQPYWKRVRAALASQEYDVVVEGDRARVDLEVGGAAGRYRLELRRRAKGWYLAD